MWVAGQGKRWMGAGGCRPWSLRGLVGRGSRVSVVHGQAGAPRVVATARAILAEVLRCA